MRNFLKKLWCLLQIHYSKMRNMVLQSSLSSPRCSAWSKYDGKMSVTVVWKLDRAGRPMWRVGRQCQHSWWYSPECFMIFKKRRTAGTPATEHNNAGSWHKHCGHMQASLRNAGMIQTCQRFCTTTASFINKWFVWEWPAFITWWLLLWSS